MAAHTIILVCLFVVVLLFFFFWFVLAIWVGSGTNNLVHSTNLLPCILIFSHGFWELELFMWTIFLHVRVV